MDHTIVGYQYSPETAKYVGVYQFPNNMDRDDIHLPPFTTLSAPPVAEPGFAAFWRMGNWVVAADDAVSSTAVPEVTDYKLITPGFIDWKKSAGMWTEEDEAKLVAAQAEIARETAEYEAAMQLMAAEQAALAGGSNGA